MTSVEPASPAAREGLERLLRCCAGPPFFMARLRKLGRELMYRGAKQNREGSSDKGVPKPMNLTSELHSPRPMARAILGSCVVFPEPVLPHTMVTWCAASAAMISSRLVETGRSFGNSMCRLESIALMIAQSTDSRLYIFM